MAERRMISKSMLMDNDFLSLSNDEKSLYLYLLIFADDDGFVKRSIMIDGVLKVSDDDYSVLEKKGLIISENNEIKVITHWNTLETIREKLYTPTVYLDFRSQLFLKVDFSYTKDPREAQVFTSADDWVKQGRPKNITDFKPLIQQHLRKLQSQDSTSTVPIQDKDSTSASPDKSSLDKDSVEKSSTEQRSTDQPSEEKITSVYTGITSSNGGMGEKSSYLHDEVEIEDGNFITQINQIMGTKIPENDERLTTLFNDATDNYKDTYIKKGLAKLLTAIQGVKLPDNQVKQLVTDHLSENIKKVTTGEESH
ncbi:hypothetical protein QUW44_05715 [Limosilactobacillus pontis]|uniref:Uncharacterized protein n=1 Tax=Limosilactobacillus pontis TaxID=35787 RepID=A0ABT7UY76_9LACO|nr:hypothetical protein [Limosilactobacillus pontis]MDM8266656.1 hypothetical protein [Limosilactobacillus pontis]